MFASKNTFSGCLTPDIAEHSVHPMLTAFIQTTLDGPSIVKGTELPTSASKAALSIAQLVTYNVVKKRYDTTSPRHPKDRETPIAIYIAMKLWTLTRSESLIQKLQDLGLCISPKRLRNISNDVANSVVAYYQSCGIVVPPSALKQVFTICLADNIDHNPSATHCNSSFHGFSMSLLQFPSQEDLKQNESVMNTNVMGRDNVSPLPDSYTVMQDIALQKGEASFVPKLTCDSHLVPSCPDLMTTISKEYTWLKHAHTLLDKDKLSQDDWVSWSAYNASVSDPPKSPNTPSVMLPLFRENANDSTTMYHSLHLAIETALFLNEGQTPVLEVDQPLYALCKKLQWKYPDTVGEDKCLLMIGAMHTEKMIYSILGDWLSGSGWTVALTKACVTTSGSAESFLGAAHITKTRYAYQVTALALYTLLLNAKTSQDDLSSSLDEWIQQQCKAQPQFLYWYKTLQLELTALAFVRSIRLGLFALYKETLGQLIPWVFALDHIHYARCLSVHLRDMCTLEDEQPGLYAEFVKGNFVGQKSKKSFSKLALDQMHEQLIAVLKGDGGIIGITENAHALRRLLVSGPEFSRMIQEFESCSHEEDHSHHEQYREFQEKFKTNVTALVQVIEEMGNPFLEDTGNLIQMDSSIVMPHEVVNAVTTVECVGIKQCDEFVEQRLETSCKAWSATISKNKLPLMSHKEKVQHKPDSAFAKDDRAKTLQILTSSLSGRDIDADLFSHELSCTPPSLSRKGEMFHGTKADIVQCLEDELPPNPSSHPQVDALVLDGAAILHIVRPGLCVTFEDYITTKFHPYILSKLDTVHRVDLVWDDYRPDSLKQGTRPC